jgi:hypothetical protein
MTKTRNMLLGGRTFAVPPLPLGVTEVVYPLCRDLSLKGALVDRVIADGLLAALTKEDMAVLIEIDFACAQVAEPTLTHDEYKALPVSPAQLFDAFFYVARFQTGMWLPVDPPAAGDDEAAAGEAKGEASPQTSILTESSPA